MSEYIGSTGAKDC